jgi:cleavage and polyadenylation specificity factor subunit 2
LKYRNVRLCHDLDQLGALSGQLVVLCSLPDLSAGYSKHLFVKYAEEHSNLVLFTEKSPKGSLASDLLELSTKSGGSPFQLNLEVLLSV